ncbi:MAG TPA: methyltransferase domain-containing protein [Candidatus Limnocylindrales bacterium]|nr:methyltransferase domain-containing protein [Candidatus Limnocylindrales bacterium]
MSHRVCPWWLGYFLISPFRGYGQNAHDILVPYVREGQTVLEPGPGMGFFTLELARLVGSSGRVIAVDIQTKMLERLKRRAEKAGVLERIDARLATPDSMGLSDLAGRVDFTLAFAMVHEVPNAARLFQEVAAASKTSATMLLAEPKGHVKEKDFGNELKLAGEAGFEVVNRPAIKHSYAAVLKYARNA